MFYTEKQQNPNIRTTLRFLFKLWIVTLLIGPMFFIAYHSTEINTARPLIADLAIPVIMFVLSAIASAPTLLIAALATHPLQRYRIEMRVRKGVLYLISLIGISLTFTLFGGYNTEVQLLILDYALSASIALGLIIANDRARDLRKENEEVESQALLMPAFKPLIDEH